MKFDIDDFYPTPHGLISEMLCGVTLEAIHTILEPSAGKGNIAKYLKKSADAHNRFRFDIDTIEIDPELQHVLKGEGFRIIHNDFLTFDTFKRYDLVIMNPPFRAGERHLLHALRFVKGEGRLVCLLNAETLKNPYTQIRQELARRLSELGADIRFRELAFTNAERPTDVEIAIVSVKMPEDDPDSVILENLRQAQDNRVPYAEPDNPLVSSDRIRAMVEHFNNEAEAGTRIIKEFHEVSWYLCKGTRGTEGAILNMSVDDRRINESGSYRDTATNFLMVLRRRYWQALFTVPEFTAKLTSNVSNELHSRVEEFAHYDFSFYNIYSLYLEITQELMGNIKKSILDLFDKFTHRHHYEEYSNNVHYFNGWKTNKAFKVNKKVIIPFYISDHYWSIYSGNQYYLPWELTNELYDIEKVFDFLSGTATTSHANLAERLKAAGDSGQRRKIETKYFYLSIFKKGTYHLEFKDPALVKKFNIFGSQQKGWLPPGYGSAEYSELEPEARDVIDSFEGKESYSQTVRRANYFLVNDSPTPLLALIAG